MRELLFSLVVTAALVVAAPMEPYDHGHVWQGSVNPYLTPSQGEGMPQWQQYPNVAPTFYVPPSGHASDSYHLLILIRLLLRITLPLLLERPKRHVSGPHSIQPSWVPDAGASAPSSSSFDTQGTFFSPQDYNRWEHSMTSSTDVPAAPHWSGPNLQDASRGWSHAIDSEMDRAILNGVMQDLRHHKSTSSVPTTPLHLDEDAFVASLLSDSPSRNELEHAREYEHHQEHAFLPTMIGPNAVSGSSLQGYQLVPGTDLTGMSRSEYQEWNRQVKQERTRSRLRRGWPEPSSFHRFNWLPSWSGRRNVMINTQVQDAHVRQRINSELFTGKLKWVELEANPSLARYLRKRTPFGKTCIIVSCPSSFQLPLVTSRHKSPFIIPQATSLNEVLPQWLGAPSSRSSRFTSSGEYQRTLIPQQTEGLQATSTSMAQHTSTRKTSMRSTPTCTLS